MPKSATKRKPRLFLRLFLMLLFVLILILLFFGFRLWSSLGPTGNGDQEVEFSIAEGEDFDSVLESLETENLIQSKTAVDLYAKFTHTNEYYAGTFILDNGMSAQEILSTIGDQSKAQADVVILTVPEGTWAKEIANLISDLYPQYSQQDIIDYWNDDNYIETLAKDYPFLDPSTLNNESYNVSLEGYLFPETYHLDKESDIDTITRAMLDQFDSVYKQYQTQFDDSGYSINELVTLASIVQFESGSTTDMPMIAGVFYNRLNQNMNLESSVTVCYALYDEFDDPQDCETSIDIVSPYNTYLNSGLPIGPILNPGEDAIKAVLEPESNDYLFFAADIYGDGKVYYSKTYEEHQEICEQLGLIMN